MIKQFNFYDIYGYLLPGMMLFVLLWMPIGILTQSWPGQDLSKAIFLAALAYVAGHILQTVANSVVPSTVVDPAKQRRFPSELLMDKSNTRFTATFKVRVAAAVEKMFGLDLAVDRDGTGNDTVSADRQTAFFHARSYLIAKKAAQYAEQFEGMYVMMRGLGCAFCAGGVYFAGWALSVRSNGKMDCVAPVFIFTALGAALICALIAFFRESVKKGANRLLALFLLLAFVGAGFLIGTSRLQTESGSTALPVSAEFVLWGSTLCALFAAVRCFSAYKAFAGNFAETIWRDYSASLSIPDSATNASDSGDAV